MNVLDLFSGIGGFSLGLERAGMRTVAFCEIEPFCRQVLANHWPHVPCYPDIRELTAARLRTDGIVPDVICGGFPCQDISSAGKGVGIGGERSGLWSEYARIIGEIRPRYVIVENVAILLARGLDRVLGDLASLRFDAEWHCIPASAIGAPHRRDRIWVVAWDADRKQQASFSGIRRGTHAEPPRIRDDVPHAFGGELRHEPGRRNGACRPHAALVGDHGASQSLAHADIDGQPQSEGAFSKQRGRAGNGGSSIVLADPERGRLQSGDVECAEQTTIIPAALSRHCGGSEFGAPWWTEPDVGRVAHGVPARVDRLKGLGNAVVPQIPEIIGRAIMKSHTPQMQSEK